MADNRVVLLDWLSDLVVEFDLSVDTLFLSTHYIDRFMSLQTVPLGELQLMGATCFFIACKYTDVKPPRIDSLVYMSDDCISRDGVLSMEMRILNALEFNLMASTRWSHLHDLLLTLSADSDHIHLLVEVSRFLVEISQMNGEWVERDPALMASACLLVACERLCVPAIDTLATDHVDDVRRYRPTEIPPSYKRRYPLVWWMSFRKSSHIDD